MAANNLIQRLSLNPGTIGGMCGRLKCCLRYEHDTYRQASQQLPRDRAQALFNLYHFPVNPFEVEQSLYQRHSVPGTATPGVPSSV